MALFRDNFRAVNEPDIGNGVDRCCETMKDSERLPCLPGVDLVQLVHVGRPHRQALLRPGEGLPGRAARGGNGWLAHGTGRAATDPCPPNGR